MRIQRIGIFPAPPLWLWMFAAPFLLLLLALGTPTATDAKTVLGIR